MSLTAQLVRILLRYVAGFLVAKGLLDAGTAEAVAGDATLAVSLELAVGGLIAAGTELAFARGVRRDAAQ